jgi:hypothetical protein
VRGLQIRELPFNPQQEKDQRKDRSQEILQKMSQAHNAQGRKMILVGGKRELS